MKELRKCFKCRHHYFEEDCKHKFDSKTGWRLQTCPKCNSETYQKVVIPTDTTKMRVRVVANYDIKEEKEVFGVVLQFQPGRRFCKYIYGLQSLETRELAQKEVDKINKQLLEESIQVDFGKSKFLGINKSQYINLNNNEPENSK